MQTVSPIYTYKDRAMRPTNENKPSQWLNALSLALVMLSCAISSANARAQTLAPHDYRILAASDKFDGVRQYSVAFEIRPPRRLRSRHLELAIGALSSENGNQPFVSLGPVWRLPLTQQATFIEFGFSPTLISESTIGGRDLGGNFHFTSSIAFGATFGRRQQIALSIRAQHTSNGGLDDTNPGLDMFGINIAFSFAD